MASLAPARPMDLGAITALLRRAGLPLDGLADHLATAWVLRENGRVVGAIGHEWHGASGLLRSLVVEPRLRGKGHGRGLLAAGVQAMRAAGLADGYGLTTAIPDLLARSDWTEVPRGDLPAELFASAELQGACPDSARAF